MAKTTSNEIQARIGERHGRLTIIDVQPNPKFPKRPSKMLYRCKCDCGAETDVLYGNLRQGISKSCGCIRREHHHRLGQGEGTRRKIFRQYRKNAERLGVQFLLTYEEFCDYIGKECYYCGEPPCDVYHQSHTTREWGTIKANGIDRIDSLDGYSHKNVVPCCKTCNYMKQEFSKDVFLDKIRRIYEKVVLPESEGGYLKDEAKASTDTKVTV